MSDPGYVIGPDGVPVPTGGWSVYNSYVTDPRYQRYLLISWTCAIGAAVILTIPSIVRYLRERRFLEGGWIIQMQQHHLDGYVAPPDCTDASLTNRLDFASSSKQTLVASPAPIRRRRGSFLQRVWIRVGSTCASLFVRTASMKFRGQIFAVSLGHFILCLLVPAILLLTLLPESQLSQNTNRAGFLALGLLPLVFLLASKASPISLLTGKSWAYVNFLHRAVATGVVVLGMIHGFGWMGIFASAGQLGERLRDGEKEKRGVLTISFLLLVFVASLPPVRKLSHNVFFVIHIFGVVGLLVAVSRHTIYSRNWIWSSAAIYAADLTARMFSARWSWCRVSLAEASLGEDRINRGAVKVFVEGAESGWRGGQFVQLYLFFTPPPSSSTSTFAKIWHGMFSSFRLFEGHPFSISNSPPQISVIDSESSSKAFNSLPKGMEFLIRGHGKGSWTGDLCSFIREQAAVLDSNAPETVSVYIPCLLIGPFGGPGYSSASSAETVMMVAGGSGISHIMGCLDDLTGTVIRGLRGASSLRRIEIVWCVRREESIQWYYDSLDKLIQVCDQSGNLSLNVSIYVTGDSTRSASMPNVSCCDPSPDISSEVIAITTNNNPKITINTLRDGRPSAKSLLGQVVEDALNPCGGGRSGLCTCNRTDSSVSEDMEKGYLPVLVEGEKKEGGEEVKAVVVVKEEQPCACCGMTQNTPKIQDTTGTGGLEILVCGPTGLIVEMRNAVSSLSSETVVRIGGVKLVEESYSL